MRNFHRFCIGGLAKNNFLRTRHTQPQFLLFSSFVDWWNSIQGWSNNTNYYYLLIRSLDLLILISFSNKYLFFVLHFNRGYATIRYYTLISIQMHVLTYGNVVTNIHIYVYSHIKSTVLTINLISSVIIIHLI